jgi:hypothetical protein
MPVVPDTAFEQHVMPGEGQPGTRPELLAYNNIDHPTADAFDGQVAGTLQQGGDMLMQNAIKRQQLANETNVNDVYANQFSPAARDIYQNYMKLEGKDAEARFPEFQQQMNDLRTRVRAGLPSMMQQKAFDEASTRRVEGDLDGMARYAAAQTKAWEWNTHTAVMSDLVNEAEANWNNPQRLQNVRDRMDNETADYASKHGWSGDICRYQLGQNNDLLWRAVIKRQALSGDFAGAMKTYQDQVSAGRISGSAQGEIEKFFKPIQDLQSAQNAYGKVTGGAMAHAIAGEAERQGVDPKTALTIWSAEGGVTNPATKNPDSSATGIFQHTSGTWSDLGGTDQDRLDASRQVQLGVALTKQNSAALAKDLGRQPQPWEVYLAHQQGIEGASALLHADPNANAGDVMGNPKAITQNRGTSDTTAGQFINYIKGYVDRHSMMYTANGVPSAQNIAQNYERHIQQLAEQARVDSPGDPTAPKRYQQQYALQAGQQIRAENIVYQANRDTVMKSLVGPNGIKDPQQFMSDPALVNAYGAVLRRDPGFSDTVRKAIIANATAMWDPPATDQTNQLYDHLSGMKDTDRAQFSDVNLMSYYGGMPIAQLNGLMDAQDRIRKNDATAAAKQTNLSSSISAVKDLTSLAAASAESPYFKMDGRSPLLPEQQKWNSFVSGFGQAIEDWQQNNSGKIPTDMQKREIAQGILFPNGAAGQKQGAAQAGVAVPEKDQKFTIPPEAAGKYGTVLTSGGYPVTPGNLRALYDQDQAKGPK